jgi:hypothetical protein
VVAAAFRRLDWLKASPQAGLPAPPLHQDNEFAAEPRCATMMPNPGVENVNKR